MGYDIPDEIKYKEKIVANLDLKQLGYAIVFGLLAFFSYKLPIDGGAKFILPAFFACIGIAFIFLNAEELALSVISYYSSMRKAAYNNKNAQKFFEVKAIEKDTIYLDDGTALAILEVQPTDFTLLEESQKRALLVNYRAFLNQLTMPIQIFIKTNTVSLNGYFDELGRNVSGRDALLRGLYADFCVFEEDFLSQQATKERKYYLVMPFRNSKQVENQVKIAQEKLSSCGLVSKRLVDKELEDLYASYADGSDAHGDIGKPKKGEESKDAFRNGITPSFDIRPYYARVNGEYHGIIKVSGYPRKVEDGWLQQFLCRNENYDISIHISPSSISSMLVYLHNQIIQQTSDLILSTAKGTPNPSLEIKKSDTVRIYDALYKGEEKMFNLALYIDNKAAELDELDLLAEKCKSNLNAQMMVPKAASWRIADGIKSTLPLAKDKLNNTREVLTGALAATFPFIAATNSNQSGILFAHEIQTLNPIFLDLEKQSNKHFFILGIPGSGKSYTAKYFIVQQLLRQETTLYIADPNGEYTGLCTSLGGRVVEISKESNSILNLFDLNGDDLGGKMLELISAFDIIMGGLNEVQKAMLSDALTNTYARKGIRPNKPETWKRKPPKFSDLKTVLENMIKRFGPLAPETKSLDAIYRRVKMYCKGGVFGFLDQDTHLNANHPVICFDLSRLPWAIKPLLIFMVLGLIKQKIMRDKEPKNVLIDEGWVLLRSKEAEQYVLEFVKTSRKFNASVGFVTQEVEDLLQSNVGKSILNSASVKILMRQSPSSLQLVSSNLRLNEYEENYLLSARKGQGLVISEDGSHCFLIQASPKIHKLITTDPNEKPVIEEPSEEKIVLDLGKGMYLRDELSSQQLGELVANGYGNYKTRMTTEEPYISYVVKVRHNEGKEHAFLCWLTESLLSKKGMKPKMASIYGPDIEVELNGKKICFEIETGKRLKYASKADMEDRFSEKAKQYNEIYIIVPNEVIGRSYQGFYCKKIITKAELVSFIEALA